MGDVVSFRPSEQEMELIDKTQVRLGLPSRAEAVRFLLRQGAAGLANPRDYPLLRLRAAPKHRLKRSLTQEDIDETLYGGSP